MEVDSSSSDNLFKPELPESRSRSNSGRRRLRRKRRQQHSQYEPIQRPMTTRSREMDQLCWEIVFY
eukprot:7817564-Pyramimonas_sp.AAC.1